MTLEVIVIAVIRIAGSLPVLRWPLIGGLLAILVDLSDLLLRDLPGVAAADRAVKPRGSRAALGYDAARARPDGRRRDEGQTAWRKSARPWVGAIA